MAKRKPIVGDQIEIMDGRTLTVTQVWPEGASKHIDFIAAYDGGKPIKSTQGIEFYPDRGFKFDGDWSYYKGGR